MDIQFGGNNLSGWDFYNQKLWGTSFYLSNLTNANFAEAQIDGTDFTGAAALGFTQAQLQSTAGYKNGYLFSIKLRSNDLSGWDFHNQHLDGTSFNSSALADANFMNAIIRGTDFSNTTGLGFSQAQLQSTASYQAGDLSSIGLGKNDLSNWNFHDQNLRYASLESANLSGTNFTNATLKNANFVGSQLTGAIFNNADVRGADFTSPSSGNLTQAQLQSTASYQSHDLTWIYLNDNDLSGWDFNSQNLSYASFCFATLIDANFEQATLNNTRLLKAILNNANFKGANLANANLNGSLLTNTDFTQADLRNAAFDAATLKNTNLSGADTRGASNLIIEDAITSNMIWPDGSIQELNLSQGNTCTIRNHVSSPYYYPPLPPIPISIQNSMKLAGTGTIKMVFDGKPWYSTISFAAGIPVDCNGTLNLTIDQSANVLAQIGKKCKLFDWSGVNPMGAFQVTSAYNWDTSLLYSTGEVSLAYSPNLADTKWTGKVSSSWNNAANWTAGVPAAGAVVEFNAAAPTRQPFLQNIGNPLQLKGILFAPGAGSHYLGGPTFQFGTGSEDDATPVIACMSKIDQFIGNSLHLESDTMVNITDSGVLNLAGEINGGGKLTKTGLGTLLLANDCYLWAGVRIQEGSLVLDETGQINYGSIANDATFKILAGDHTVSFINGGGTTVVLSGTLTAESIVQDTLTIGNSGSQASQPVPEPGMLGLLMTGLAGFFVLMVGRAHPTKARKT